MAESLDLTDSASRFILRLFESHRTICNYLVTWLAKLGFDAQLMPTPGWPLVLGLRFGQPAAPTVLLYGHYDVQPPEPLDEWISPALSVHTVLCSEPTWSLRPIAR